MVRSSTRRRTHRGPRRPRGERAKLLRFQGELIGELKEAMRLARQAPPAQRSPAPQGPRSARATNSSQQTPDILDGRAFDTLSI